MAHDCTCAGRPRCGLRNAPRSGEGHRQPLVGHDFDGDDRLRLRLRLRAELRLDLRRRHRLRLRLRRRLLVLGHDGQRAGLLAAWRAVRSLRAVAVICFSIRPGQPCAGLVPAAGSNCGACLPGWLVKTPS